LTAFTEFGLGLVDLLCFVLVSFLYTPCVLTVTLPVQIKLAISYTYLMHRIGTTADIYTVSQKSSTLHLAP